MPIHSETTITELAVLVSQALEEAGITATLSGGGAVSIYTANRYQSRDLDFVTLERRDNLEKALSPLGFVLARDLRHFTHPQTDYFLEFPTAPLAFGGKQIRHEDIPVMATQWGPLRVITPTLCIMDRLSAFWHWSDRQSWDQAVLVARFTEVDERQLVEYAREEGAEPADIDALLAQARR